MATVALLHGAAQRRLSRSGGCVLHSHLRVPSTAAVWCAVIAASVTVVGVGGTANVAAGSDVDAGWDRPRGGINTQVATDTSSGAEDRAFLVSLVVRVPCVHACGFSHIRNAYAHSHNMHPALNAQRELCNCHSE